MTSDTRTAERNEQRNEHPAASRGWRAWRDRIATWPKDYALDLIRIYLGAVLFARGALFVSDPALVMEYMEPADPWIWPMAIAHYVALAHLGGGLLLLVGWYTRLAALLQLPVLLGAVFGVHLGEPLFTAGGGQSLELAALVLMLLIVLTVFGSGRLSLDRVMQRTAERERSREAPPLRPYDVGYAEELKPFGDDRDRYHPGVAPKPPEYRPHGQTGPEGARTARPELARTLEHELPQRPGYRAASPQPGRNDAVDEASEESFPASDAPGYTGGHA